MENFTQLDLFKVYNPTLEHVRDMFYISKKGLEVLESLSEDWIEEPEDWELNPVELPDFEDNEQMERHFHYVIWSYHRDKPTEDFPTWLETIVNYNVVQRCDKYRWNW